MWPFKKKKQNEAFEKKRMKNPICPDCGFGLFYDASFMSADDGAFVCGHCRALILIYKTGDTERKEHDAADAYEEAMDTPLVYYGTDGCSEERCEKPIAVNG